MREQTILRSQDCRIVSLIGRHRKHWHGIRRAISLALCFLLVAPNIACSVVYAQDIIADGRTSTVVTEVGTVTNVTTSTMIGENSALNSFSKFNVAAGHTVNLHVPSGADNLLNLVYSEEYTEPSYIRGVLNSIKDGKIGGNVFFLNPYGLVVSSEGVVNVGSLTAITPTLSFMDSFFDWKGDPSSAAISQVLSGSVPVSKSGLITVQGKINAIKDITLSAGDVSVESSGSVLSGAVFQAARPDFSDVVNISGMESGQVVSTENGNIVIKAVNDIEISGGTVASQGAGSLNAGSITLEAGNSITVSGQILAEGHGDSSNSGNIKLIVQQTDHTDDSAADAAASIELTGATLKGRNIELRAESDAQYEWSGESDGLVLKNIDDKIDFELEIDVATAEAKAASSIIIGTGSTLEAEDNVTLTANAMATAKASMKDKDTGKDLSVSFLYGEVDSDATIDVQNGARIRATNLSLSARNTATLDVAAQTVSEDSDEGIEAAIAVGFANVTSSAILASGSDIDVTGILSISATNQNSFSTSSTTKVQGDGFAGIAAAFFVGNTHATAASDTNLSGLTDLAIQAVDATSKNATTASGAAGGGEAEKKGSGTGQKGTSFIQDKLGKKSPQLDENSGATEGPRLAGAISISDAEQGATARIGDGAVVQVANNISLAADTRVLGLQNKAESSVASKKDKNETTAALSAAVAYGNHTRHTDVFIGDNAQVSARWVELRSNVTMPFGLAGLLEFQWSKLTGVSTIVDGVKELKDIAGSPILTSYANATESATDLGVAGSVSYMDLTNISEAYVGRGATITLLPTEGTTSDRPALMISADTKIVGVFAAGNISFALQGAGGEPGAASAGGAYNQVNNTNRTRAYISAGASVQQDDSDDRHVSIAAHTDEVIVALGPTAGRGASFGLSGAFSLAKVNSTTEASVSDRASLNTRILSIKAREDVVSWSLTGAFNSSQSAGVGVNVSINKVDTDTRAFVGQNSGNPADSSLPQGQISASWVDVEAVTDGAIQSYSVAAAVASSSKPDEPEPPKPEDPNKEPGALDKAKSKLTDALGKLGVKTDDPKNAGKGADTPDPEVEAKFGLAISGSSSINLGSLKTRAYVQNAQLNLTGDSSMLSVRGINSTDVIAASGGAALAKAGSASSEWSAGIAGSIALNQLENTTSASVLGSKVTGAKTVDIQGLAAGLQVAVALGVAINASADQDTAGTAAGSVSVNLVSNKVESAIENSEMAGQAAGSDRTLDVVAYDRTTVGTGGGSLIAGGKGGVGAAVTYSSIANTVDARLKKATVSGYDDVRVHGLTASLIGSGGAMAAFTKEEKTGTLAGSIVVNSISNTTSAQILDGSVITVAGDIDVVARDTRGHAELDAIIDDRLKGKLVLDADYSGSEFFAEEQSDDGTSIISVAGVVQVSGNNVGISFAWNEVGNQFKALVNQSTLTAADVNVEAYGGTFIVGLAVGVGVATGKFAGAASVAANETGSFFDEEAGNIIVAEVSQATVTAGSLTVKATDKTQIHSLAGQVTAGIGKASAGGAIAHNLIGNTVVARLAGSTVNASTGAVSVLANNDSTIRTAAAAAGGSAEVAFNASVASAHISNTTTAEVVNSVDSQGEGTPTPDVKANQLSVLATDASLIQSLTGGATFSKSAALGGAVSINTIGNKTRASIIGGTLDVGTLLNVKGRNESAIHTIAAAIGGSKDAAINGSVSDANIFNETEAYIGSSILMAKTGSVTVEAEDASEINALSGSAGGAKSAAIGGALSVNTVTNRTNAQIEKTTVDVGNQLKVGSLSNATIRALSAYAAGAGDAAVGGSAATSVITNTTEALVSQTSGSAGSITVAAQDESTIESASGGISGAGQAAVGGAATVGVITNNTSARVSKSGLVSRGLFDVGAINKSTIRILGIAAGGSSSASVMGGITAATVVNTTEAEIADSTVTASGGTAVQATDSSELEQLAVTIAGSGTAAVGGAALGSAIANTTSARISNSGITVTSENDEALKVAALNQSTIKGGAAAGGGSGEASVTGSATTSVITNTTEALVDNAGLAVTGGAVIDATDKSKIESLAGNISLSGAAAVGGAVTVNTVLNTTRARLSNTTAGTIDVGALELNAANRSSITTGAVGAGASGSAAVTGSDTTSIIKNTTEALLVDVKMSDGPDMVQVPVTVAASDESRIQALAGNAGASGAAAVGGAIAVNVIANTTRAEVRGGSLNLSGATSVSALNKSTIESIGVSAAGSGAASVTGSVAVSDISNTTEAVIVGATVKDNSGGDSEITVLATDQSTIRSVSGAAAASGATSVGAASSTNRIANTTRARVTGGTMTDIDGLLVKGVSEGTIESLAVGVGADVNVGVAGSVAINLMTNNTESYIDGGAKIVANNNVGVVAENHDLVRNAAGTAGIGVAAAGVGASVTVNYIGGGTKAYIGGSGTEVTALALDSSRKLTVAEGSLDGAISLGQEFFDDSDGDSISVEDLESLASGKLKDRRKTETVTGVAVNASSTRVIQNAVANISGGLYAGVAGTASVNVITSSTEAYVAGSKVNEHSPASAGSAQGLSIKASDHAYSLGVIGSIGLGAGGVGAGVDTVVFSGTTRAYVGENSSVRAKGATVVGAQSTQSASSFAVSGGVGVVGAAGTGVVGIFSGTTSAYIDDAAVNTGSLDVQATHDGRLLIGAGGIAGGAGALSGTFAVASDSSTTSAYIDGSTVQATDDISVSAEGNLEVHSLAASGALGGSGSVAGSALVSLSNNTTEAYVKNSQLGSLAQRTGDVSILAHDRVTIVNLAGAAGIDMFGVGVGASAAVTSITNTTSAYVQGSSIYTRDGLTVDALAERDLSSVAVSAGVGASVGIGGAAAVTLVGSVLSGDVVSELDKDGNGTLSEVNRFAGGDRLTTDGDNANMKTGETVGPKRTNTVDPGDDSEQFTNTFDGLWEIIDDETQGKTITAGVTNEDLGQTNRAGKAGVTDSLYQATPAGTTAQVIDSTVDAYDDVRINAGEWFEATIHSGALAGGSGAGVGGSVGVMVIGTNVKAEVLGSSSVLSRQGKIEILAEAGRLWADRTAVSVSTYQGAAGFVGLGAAVSVADVTNNVIARAGEGTSLSVGGTAGEDQEKLAIKANDWADVEAEAYGATVGFVAAGVVAATAFKRGTTGAYLAATNGLTVGSGLLLVESNRSGAASSFSAAGAGGVVSGAGSAALATDNGRVEALISEGVNVTAEQASVQVLAMSQPEVSADARGFVGAIYGAIGVSAAEASTSISTNAGVGSGGSISAKKLSVSAIAGQNGRAPSVKSKAVGGSIGLLAGTGATYSSADSSSAVTASIRSNLNVTGDVRVFASNATVQEAEAFGVAGGLVGAGANIADASANSTTVASVGNGVSGSVSGQLSVSAVGSDDTRSKVVSGSGGVVSGAAAAATTHNNSSTRAEIGAGSLLSPFRAGKILLNAAHTAIFNGQTDSVNAAVVGASGAVADHDIRSTVEAAILSGAVLETYDLAVKAENNVSKPELAGEFNAKAGSGGLAGGAAVRSESVIRLNTYATIGSNAQITVIGDRFAPGRTDFSAINNIAVYDRTKLDAGGAIAIARAESRVKVNTSNAEVRMGEGAHIDSVGTVNFGARTSAYVSTSANAKTYGAAGAAQGISESTINTSNRVTIADRAYIRAHGDVNLYAGRDAAGGINSLGAIARTDLFNKTAFPIKTSPDADALITQNNLITTGSLSVIASVRDVTLMATKGSAVADGQGVGKDLYRQLAEDIANAFGSIVGAGDVSLDIRGGSSRTTGTTGVVVDGLAHAGIQNKQRLTIDSNGNVTEITEGVTYETTVEDVAANMFDRLKELEHLRSEYDPSSSAWAAFNAEINYIKNELLTLGYAEQIDGVIYVIESIPARFITVNDVVAQGGNVNVYADYLAGSGSLLAPNDAEITIINHSGSFLRLNRLTVDQRGGLVLFNEREVTSAADVNERNLGGSPAANLVIDSAGSSSVTPTITVRNTYDPTGIDTVPPDIELTGNVINRTGTVTITNATGSIKLIGRDGSAAPSILADSIHLSAGRDIVQSYVDGFVHIGGDPRSKNSGQQGSLETTSADKSSYQWGSDSLNWSGTGSWIAGNNIYISARYLNINGTIQSGIPDWTLQIIGSEGQYVIGQRWVEDPLWVAVGRPSLWFGSKGSYQPVYGTLDQYLEYAFNDWVQRGRPSMSDPDNLHLYSISGSGDTGNITAYYNPETDKIEINGVKVQGGYAELYGEIMNTGGGKIKVMDGHGRISIANTTSKDIVINGLDTGDVHGVIRITDTAKKYNGTPITTVFERVDGFVQTRQYAGEQLLSTETSNLARSATYSPVSGLRYYWTRGQDMSHTGVGAIDETKIFWGAIPVSRNEYQSFTVEREGQPVDLPGGTYTGIASSLPAYYFYSKNYTTSDWAFVSRDEWKTYHWADFIKSTPTYHIRDTWKKTSQTVYTHSIKADYAISVEFIGYDEGNIWVNSRGNIVLADYLRNQGTVQLDTDGSIIQTSATAVVSGSMVQMHAGTGIGDDLAPISVQLLGNSGVLTAGATTGDISIRGIGGDTRIGSIVAEHGSVRLDADGDIVQANAGGHAVIEASRIDLVSRTGGIGTASQPLNVQVGNEQLSGLNATAPGDISIRQVNGDLRLVRVESLGGDVTLEVANGTMVDANPEEKRDTRTTDELLRLWDEMLLTGDAADESAANTVKAYKQTKEYEYQTYWRMRNVQPVRDEHGNITGYTSDPYDPSNPDAEYQRLHEAYGAGEYVANWTYTLSDEELDSLTQGASWTENELTMALSGGILFKQTTSTETVYKDPNVKGRNITLRALNGSVGTDNGQVVIDGNDPNALKNEANRIALAAAEPDDVAVDNEAKQITVLLRKAVNVAATGEITVEARDHVYLGSRTPIYVDTVESGGSIRIRGKEGIYTVDISGPPAIQGGRTILEGGDGGLGTPDLPLTLLLQAGATLTARAGQSINLIQTSGDLSLAEIYSVSDVNLTAAGSILDSRGDRPVTVMGYGVNLNSATGSIGQESNPIVVAVSPTGQFNASALNGGVYAVGSSTIFSIGTVSSGGGTSIAGTGAELSVLGSVQSAGPLRLAAAGVLRLGSLASLQGNNAIALVGRQIDMVEGSTITATNAEFGVSLESIEDTRVDTIYASTLNIVAGQRILQHESGMLSVQRLVTSSGVGQQLIGANRVARFSATNSGSEAIVLNNVPLEGAPDTLVIEHISQTEGGDVQIANDGSIELSGVIDTEGTVRLGAAAWIFETGEGRVVNAALLDTRTGSGQLLLGANAVKKFTAASNSGPILFANTADTLEVADLSQAMGGDVQDVQVVNSGDIELIGTIDTAGNVWLTASGRIVEGAEGRVVNAVLLVTSSGSGQTLTGANAVETFSATNSGDGAILFANTADKLVVADVSQVEGGDIEIVNVGDLELVGEIDTDGSVRLSATASIEEGETGRVVNAALLATSSGSGQTLLGNNTVASFSALNSGSGDIVFSNAADELDLVGVAQVGEGSIAIANVGDIIATKVVAGHGTVDLRATGSILEGGTEVSNIDAASINLVAESGSIGQATDHLRVDSSYAVAGSVNASAPHGVYLTEVDGDLSAGRVESSEAGIHVVADGSILNSGSVDVSNFEGASITLTAQNGGIGRSDARVTTKTTGTTDARADLDIYVEEQAGDLDSNYMISDNGSVDLYAPDGSIRIKQLHAADTAAVETPYDALLDEISVAQLNVALTGQGSRLVADYLRISHGLGIEADIIELANLMHTGDEPLRLTVGGGSKSMADNVTIHASSDVGILFNRLEADFSVIAADVDDLGFEHVLVGSRADINNSHHKVIADNVAWELYDCYLQLRPWSRPFYLYMRGDRQIMTDAMNVNYSDDYIINDFSTENSLVRLAAKMLETFGHESNWMADSYQSSLQASLSSGRTNVIISLPDSELPDPETGGTDSFDEDETTF